MVPLGFGTQTAGSVIRPASFCGVVGYKPSFGLISRAGVKPLADSLDTVGVYARNVEDAAFFAGALSDRPALRQLTIPSRPPRFGLYRTPMWDAAEPATAAALDAARQALERAGAAVEELAIAPEHHRLTAAQDKIMGYETCRALADERIRHSAELSPRLAQLLDAGMAVGSDEYDAACAAAAAARAGLAQFFGGCDAVLTPAAPGEAPPGLGYTGDPVFNRMWTLLGTPCVAICAHRGESGLPTAVQMVGRIGDDARLMACAAFLERALAA
jgi:Asp-tRNA(Asn)/Glu-tRNA(Gln) amidotransferase A subunit family amidase